MVAVNNEVDAPDATVYLVGTAHNTLGIVQPAPVPLVISDDDRVVVTLVLEPEVIAEDGGQSAVTAALDRPSSAAVTVTVTAEAAPPAPDAFTLSGSRVLTIAAGDTASAATVTITAADDSAAGDKRVLVRGSVTGGNGAPPPAVRVLIIRDDDTAPSVTLELSSHAIAEDGGSATVAAVLDYPASADTTVTVTVTPVAPAASTDFSLSANPVLAIAAGATASSGGVTITAVDNNLVTAHKQFRVGASVTGGDGAAAPPPVTLVIEDDEAPPVLALTLTPASIAEAAGVSTVTATLDRALGAQRTVTISAAARPPAQDTAFTQSGTVLTFPAGSTTSTGLVTITAVDDRDSGPGKRVTVSASPDGFRTAGPASATLSIPEDDLYGVYLLLHRDDMPLHRNLPGTISATISENGGHIDVVAICATLRVNRCCTALALGRGGHGHGNPARARGAGRFHPGPLHADHHGRLRDDQRNHTHSGRRQSRGRARQTDPNRRDDGCRWLGAGGGGDGHHCRR